VPILYAAFAFFKSFPLNQILDWNSLLQSSFMGSWYVSHIAPSEWWHMYKPCLAKANAGNVSEEKGQDHKTQHTRRRNRNQLF